MLSAFDGMRHAAMQQHFFVATQDSIDLSAGKHILYMARLKERFEMSLVEDFNKSSCRQSSTRQHNWQIHILMIRFSCMSCMIA